MSNPGKGEAQDWEPGLAQRLVSVLRDDQGGLQQRGAFPSGRYLDSHADLHGLGPPLEIGPGDSPPYKSAYLES